MGNVVEETYKLNSLSRLIDDIESDISKYLDEKKDCENVSYRNILIFALGKSLLEMREIIVLCSNGLPDGALAVARNIFEQFIIVSYLNIHRGHKDFEKLLEKYNDDYSVTRAKALQFYYTEVINDESQRIIHIEKQQGIKDKYDIRCKGKLSDYWWSNCNSFSEMCDKVAVSLAEDMRLFVRYMQFIYKRACLAIHSSCMGNRTRLGSDFDGVDMGPWTMGHETPLFLGCSAILMVVGLTYKEMELSYTDVIGQLNDYSLFFKTMIIDRSKERL